MYVLIWVLGVLIIIVSIIVISLRVVVPTNEVHTVQRSKTTIPYGKDQPQWAVYYKRPHRVPILGIERILLPTSIFTVDLENYEAYDIGKVPFVVDIKARFRVDDAGIAAQRIDNFDELHNQLDDIIRGTVRKVLASHDIENIMTGRKTFGEEFFSEIAKQASEYGVTTINIEFMDIRDPQNWSSQTIADIMDKKKSLINKQSRVEVAKNTKEAKIAEIEAKREADIAEQVALRQVWEADADKQKLVGIATQKAKQQVAIEMEKTKEKEMAVLKVESVKTAEIEKEAQIVLAEQQKEQMIIDASWQKEQQISIAKGAMEAELNKAKGIEAVWLAEAEALKAKELAPVSAQIELAKEIGSNQQYQEYLLGVEGIKAGIDIGVAKAQALESGDLKIIATPWATWVDGWLNNIMDIFSGKGGTSIATMLETLNQTDAWKDLYNRIIWRKDEEKTDTTEGQPADVLDTTDIKWSQQESS